MTHIQWTLTGIGVAIVGVSWYFKDDIEDLAVSFFSKTKLVDGTVYLDGVPADPQGLADADQVDLDTYALARMVQSEAGNLNDTGKQGVAFAALTYARNAGKAISAVLLKGSGGANGYFGQQNQGRYASTSRDPGQSAYNAAIIAIGGVSPDPTGGADQWDSPQSYSDPARAEVIAQARTDAGKVKIILPSVPERKLRFWRKA